MKATLVKTIPNDIGFGSKRFYRLSEPITKGKSDITGEVDIIKEFNNFIEKRVKPEYVELFRSKFNNKCELVAISDAHTHIETLVFPALQLGEDDFYFTTDDIGGKHTMMIYGGDPESVYEDEVYLRRLAQLNCLKWEGIEEGGQS